MLGETEKFLLPRHSYSLRRLLTDWVYTKTRALIIQGPRIIVRIREKCTKLAFKGYWVNDECDNLK
jgi:hypothetical protein